MKIFGDYHMHTVYSDGRATVLEMAVAAKKRELLEIAITDHGYSKILNGMRKRNIDKTIGEIESARSELPILLGIESNLTNTRGGIDVPKNLRDRFQIVLFGVHLNVAYSPWAILTFLLPNIFWRAIHFTPRFQKRYNTKLVKRAIEKNQIDIWTHPNRYMRVNVVEIAKTCQERGTLVELNARRISFRPIDFERMAATGAQFIIGSDAHAPRRVGEISRAEEFLKNCDYNPQNIINLNTTYTEWKNAKLSNKSQIGNQTIASNAPNGSVPKRSWLFRKRLPS